MAKVDQSRRFSGLTSIRTGSDLISSNMSSSCFEADSNSDLHSIAFGPDDGRAEQLRQSFAKVITNYYNESSDSVDPEGKPDIKETG